MGRTAYATVSTALEATLVDVVLACAVVGLVVLRRLPNAR
jgi:hypothetical protein